MATTVTNSVKTIEIFRHDTLMALKPVKNTGEMRYHFRGLLLFSWSISRAARTWGAGPVVWTVAFSSNNGGLIGFLILVVGLIGPSLLLFVDSGRSLLLLLRGEGCGRKRVALIQVSELLYFTQICASWIKRTNLEALVTLISSLLLLWWQMGGEWGDERKAQLMVQLIGLRENIPENPIIHGKLLVSD